MKKIVLLIALSFSLQAPACTGLRLANKANGYVYARTLEFAQNLESQFLFIPRNYAFSSSTPSGKNDGLKWNAAYAAIGANAFGLPCYVDGVNEKGLAGGLFYFPGFAEYQDVKPENYSSSIPMWQLLTWILTSCASIEDVKKSLPTLFISKALLPAMKNTPPAHLIVHDGHGKSVVIECVKGIVNLHDNPLGVITNAPTFDWHMTNLRNYINLSAVNAPDKIIAGVPFSQLGQGSGLIGLPGDFTPPSRFVRVTAFSQSAPITANEIECVMHAFHILNNFDIPKGSVMDRSGITETTQWTGAADMKNKIYYIKTYNNFQLQKVELMKRDLHAKTHTMIPFVQTNTIQELI